jgi:hypothetical protein
MICLPVNPCKETRVAQRIDGADPARDQSEEALMHKLGIVSRPWLPLGLGKS